MTDDRDRWTAGSIYEYYMGRWSRRLAPRFVSWLKVPHGVHWLDVGCGTGALTAAICDNAAPASVVGCDRAKAFVTFAQEHNRDARVSFVAAGVGSLPRRSDGYGCVASSLALNFFPDPDAAVHEMRSITAAQGTVSACVWDYSDGMQFLRRFWDAVCALDSAARQIDEGNRFPLCHPDALTALFVRNDIENVRCEAIEIPTVFSSFEDYWKPFLGGTGPAPSYVASLDADGRARLARRLEETLRREDDGTIILTARAWAVCGTVQG